LREPRQERISNNEIEYRMSKEGVAALRVFKIPSVPLFQRGKIRFAAFYHFSKGEDGQLII